MIWKSTGTKYWDKLRIGWNGTYCWRPTSSSECWEPVDDSRLPWFWLYLLIKFMNINFSFSSKLFVVIVSNLLCSSAGHWPCKACHFTLFQILSLLCYIFYLSMHMLRLLWSSWIYKCIHKHRPGFLEFQLAEIAVVSMLYLPILSPWLKLCYACEYYYWN